MQISLQDQMLLKEPEVPEVDDTVNRPARVLTERNAQALIRPSVMRSHFELTASAQRRHDALRLRLHKEKSRRRRMVRRIEYQRLRTMVPSIAKKPLVSKVTVIEEAIRYIDYLHEALLARLKTKGLPSCLQGANVDIAQLRHEDIKNLVCQLVENNSKKAKRLSSSCSRNRRPLANGSSGDSSRRARHLPTYLVAKPGQRKRT